MIEGADEEYQNTYGIKASGSSLQLDFVTKGQYSSNVGSRKILQLPAGGGGSEAAYASMRAAVKSELGTAFRPEFLNRLDEVIVFEALDQEQVGSVASLMLAELVSRCEENEIELSTTKRLTDAIVASGYSPTYGARPLRRAVQRLCEDAVAEAMLSGFVQPGEKLELDGGKADGEIVLKNGKGKTRVHQASAAQGIEDEAGAAAAAPAGAGNVVTTVTKPASSL